MGIEGIEHLKPEGFIEIGPECFADDKELVISYKGRNFYKACDIKVTNKEEGGSTFCVKRVGHPGLLHEDWDGAVSTGLE